MWNKSKKMGYEDILKKIRTTEKQKFVPVFSDIIGDSNDKGKLADFLLLNQQTVDDYRMGKSTSLLSNEMEYLNDLKRLYRDEAHYHNMWLTMMGLLEIKILQHHCLASPRIAYSLQIQKSGDKKFNYIVLRFQFYSVLQGKKEIRIYFNKIEDYPKYKTLDELKKDKSFILESEKVVREEMRKEIEKDHVTFEQFKDNFQEVEKNRGKYVRDTRVWGKK